MKTSLKLILAGSLLSVGFAGTASANTDVYITGSSAFRAGATEALAEMLTQTDGGGTPPLVSYAQNTKGNANVSNSNSQLFVGYPTAAAVTKGMTAHTQYWIHTDWTGSLAGLSSLVYAGITPAPQSGATHPFLPDTLPTAAIVEGSYTSAPVTGNIVVTNPSGGQSLAVNAETVDHVADGAFSDVYQSSTQYSSPNLTQAGGGVVGIIPFVWVNGLDAAATGKITNISAVQAVQLLEGGLAVAQFSGIDADNANYVVPVGRNADSGTRFTTFAETGFNPVGGAVQQPQQYAISTSGSAVLVDLYPAETLFSGTAATQSYTAGQSGYSSGGNEATALSISGTNGGNSDNANLTMGYIGESDGTTVVKAGGSYVSYNGVAYGTLSGSSTIYNRSLIDEGVYTMWGYEHLYIGTSTTFGSLLNALATQVRGTDAPYAGESITRMAVQRDYEGGPISYVGLGNSTK